MYEKQPLRSGSACGQKVVHERESCCALPEKACRAEETDPHLVAASMPVRLSTATTLRPAFLLANGRSSASSAFRPVLGRTCTSPVAREPHFQAALLLAVIASKQIWRYC